MTSSDATPLEVEAASNIRETKSMVRVASIDWEETPTAHVFKVDLPGLKKEEVKVKIEDSSILQISGHWNRESLQDQTHTCHRQEHSSGGFLRRIRLPDNAIRLPDNAVTKVDEAKATMEDGVLTLTLPKGHPKEPHVTSNQISA